MALALLDLLGLDASRARLRIDTGTNRYYQLKLGYATAKRDGFDWIDEVVHQTAIAVNPAGGGLLNTATELTVPIRGLTRARRGLPLERLFVQLFSFKSPDGRAIGFSQVLPLERAMASLDSIQTVTATEAHAPARLVACRTCSEQMSEPRIADLLGQIVKVLGPAVVQLFGQQSGAAAGTQAPGAAGTPAPSTQASGGGGSVNLGSLVQAIGTALPGILKLFGGGASVSASQSTLLRPDVKTHENRFAGRQALAEPMIFGLDDVVIGQLVGQIVGPFVKALPELLNSNNQARVQLDQSRNHLVSDLVGQVQRRMLLEQVLQAQQQAPPSQAAQLQQLASLLQQAEAGSNGAAPAAGAATAPATASSLSEVLGLEPVSGTLSSRAIAMFVTAPAVAFPGGDQVLFARGRPATFQIKLAVADPAPKAPVPKAIVRVLIKDPDSQQVLAEKAIKQHDLAANAVVPVTFTAEQLATVPTGRPLSLLGEIRWLTSAGAERKALGSHDVVFVDRLFVKSRGENAGPERELTDMGRYRPFWNKVWESPSPVEGKTLWGLDVTMKYTVLLTVAEHSNGLMQTRLSSPPDGTADELRMQTSGRMKAGIECSVDELAKLATLWDGEPALDADHASAFRSLPFARQNASDSIVRVKLDGPRDERGLVWVVPVVQLVDHTLGVAKTVDDSGQVTAVDEEHAHFPLPVAIRVLSLRSGESGEASSDGGDESTYHFDGYRVDHSEKVALTIHG